MKLRQLFLSFIGRPSVKTTQNDDELVKKSISQYKETYKLLEAYDKKPVKRPEELADPGRLREVVRELQKPNGNLGTHPAV